MEDNKNIQEFTAKVSNGMLVLILDLIVMVICFIIGILDIAMWSGTSATILVIVLCIYFFIVGPIILCGLKVVRPNEAIVLSLFGKYHGTIRKNGFYFVNPFTNSVMPNIGKNLHKEDMYTTNKKSESINVIESTDRRKRISLKVMTLNNEKQKINDQLGNPIIIGIVVFWKVVNTANAVFNVDNYKEFLTTQCDSALRNIVRLYPYDTADVKNNEKSLRGSSVEIAQKLKEEIQSKVDIAGLEIVEARITHLSYSQEIAAAMLQRQQASAIIDARQMIVEGAVSMVEMAINKLSEEEVVDLDEERKAAMVSNLLVVLCANKETQPVVNSGSLY